MTGLLNNLASNPLFNVGMGLLSQGPSRYPINPWQGVQQGLLNAQHGQSMQAQRDQLAVQQQREAEAHQMQMQNQQQQMYDTLYKRAQDEAIKEYINKGEYEKAFPEAFAKEKFEQQFEGMPGGAFVGKNIEAQMLNLYLSTFKEGPERDAERLRLARQRLQRPSQISTPHGVYTRPGYNLAGGGAGGGANGADDAANPLGKFTPKDPSEGMRKDLFSAGNMAAFDSELDALEKTEGFDPTSIGVGLAGFPGTAGLVGAEADAYNSAADGWTRLYVMLISGATAREEEVVASHKLFFPRVGGDPSSIKGRAMRRKVAMIHAYTKARSEGRAGSAEADKHISSLKAQLVELRKSNTDIPSGGDLYEKYGLTRGQ